MPTIRRRRDTPHGEEWVFPFGFIAFWVIAVIVVVIAFAIWVL